MTTEKQIAANKANAQKSTGPKTDAGKAVVAGNAISHGILSKRLLLEDESPDDFQALQDDLRQALRPMGALELALVEKVAVALWKQKRLVAAETATIELGRHMRKAVNRDDVKCAMGLGYADDDVTEADLEPLGADDKARQQWCIKVLSEFALVSDEVMAAGNLVALAKIGAVKRVESKIGNKNAAADKTSLSQIDNDEPTESKHNTQAAIAKAATTYRQLHRRPLVQSIAAMVQAQKSAPMGNEVLMRYQVALDGELYRAMEALRKQQAFRLKLGIEVEGEVVS